MRRKQTAIVTGGASGFGEAIVKKFLAEGARVVIADINQKAAEDLSQTLAQILLRHIAMSGIVRP